MRASFALGTTLLTAQMASAQLPEEDEPLINFGGSIYLEARHVQNANRTPVEANEIEELQLQYGGNLFGSIDREKIALTADYDFYQNEYLEDTQESRFIRTGRSNLVLGTDTTFYQLDLSHSTQRFLADRTGPTILANTDQRDITSVTPLLRVHPGRGDANSIGVYGQYSDVTYKRLAINDSERVGYGVMFQRRTSPVHTLSLNVMENDIDFKHVDEVDYRYRRAVLSFSAELRQLNYNVDLGINEASPMVGEAVDRFYYNLAASHTTYGSTWNLTANRTITDTSLGNANNPFFSDGITADTSTTVQDQLELRSYGLSWSSNFLCPRCTVGVRAGYEDEKYFNVAAEDQTEIFGGGSFSYVLRPSADLQFSLMHRRREFVDEQNYAETAATVALDIDPVLRYFDTRLWYQIQQRNPEAGDGYYTGAVGVTVAYNF